MAKFTEHPLRLVLTGCIALVSVLTFVSALLISYSLSKHNTIKDQARHKSAVQLSLARLDRHDKLSLRNYLNHQSDLLYAIITTSEGETIALKDNNLDLNTGGRSTELDPDLGDIRYLYDSNQGLLTVFQPIPWAPPSSSQALLTSTFNISSVIDTLQTHYIRDAITLSLIGIVGVWIVALLLQRFITLPLERLAFNAVKMADGNYQIQNIESGNNEVGRLSQALNKIGKKTHSTLLDLEQRNQQLHDFLHCGLIAMSVESDNDHFVEINQEMQEITGFTEQELFSLGWKDLIHPDSQPEFMAFKALLGYKHDNIETEVQIFTKQRQPLWISVVGRELARQESSTPMNLYFVRDIQTRKQAELDLRLSAVAFETQEAILVSDVHTNILKVNKAFTRITGYSSKEAIGVRTNLLQSGHHPPEFYQTMWQSLQEKGRWQGEIWNRKKNGQSYPQWQTITAVKNETGHISHYIACFQDISERKRAEEEIRQLAYYDELTGLPNRRMFYQRLQQAVAASKRSLNHGALIFIDLDHFKDVNDSLGHLFGDKLLQEVGFRLSELVRTEDTLARLGGDEFVIMLENLDTDYDKAALSARQLCERLITRLGKHYLIENQTLRVSASVGISLFPTDSDNIDDLLRQADTAMYKSKANGRSTLRFFSHEMQNQANARLQLRSDLEQALKRNEFRLHLQPQVNIKSNNVIGCESLLRWQHPARGLVGPGEFLSIAEESNLIIQIGEWTLNEACRIQNKLRAKKLNSGRISINIHPKQFHLPDFVQKTLNILEFNQTSPRDICIEITESVAIANLQEAADKIAQLQNKGIHVAIDDFGIGYSSLSYLVNLHARELKLDRSFISQLDHKREARIMVKNLISLAHQLHMQVVAEGVETQEQRELLERLDCNILQGYLESKPLSLDDYYSYIESHERQLDQQDSSKQEPAPSYMI
jgi:diguanylate cyclase (GGDEF)-like protein/PAS domain S-box-containing protein